MSTTMLRGEMVCACRLFCASVRKTFLDDMDNVGSWLWQYWLSSAVQLD